MTAKTKVRKASIPVAAQFLPSVSFGRESLADKQIRCRKILALLKKHYPDSKCSLEHQNPFQLLIATILSAQCTDDRVNKTTPALFAKYPNASSMQKAQIQDLEELIRPTGFYKNKARNILAAAKIIAKKYVAGLPQTVEELHELPGVGRKTANVVLGTAFGIPGMVVDTHVTRISNRFAFVKGNDAVKLEKELMKIVDRSDWVQYTHLIIDHGRAICVARSPKCDICFLAHLCPKKPYSK